jgi:hypothetical protein
MSALDCDIGYEITHMICSACSFCLFSQTRKSWSSWDQQWHVENHLT